MYLYAQHGPQKAVMIEQGIRRARLSGVILSPRDDDPDRLAAFARMLRRDVAPDAVVLMDPQFYASGVVAPNDGQLPHYPYYRSGLTRGQFSPADIRHYVRSTLDYQLAMINLNRIVSPTVLFSSFSDPWNQIAISMAQESLDKAGEEGFLDRLLVSFVVDEGALNDGTGLDDFLDLVSVWKARGFYLILQPRETNYPASYGETSLANFLYLVYVLADLTGFEVVSGYSDLVGILLHAVGAHATGTGWHQSLRQFSLNGRFGPRRRGGPKAPRYTSGPLLNSIFIEPELRRINEEGFADRVLSNTAFDRAMGSRNPGNVPWPLDDACLHHWTVLEWLTRDIASAADTSGRLDAAERLIAGALDLYGILGAAGVGFGSSTGRRHLEQWRGAVNTFRSKAGV